MTVTDTHSAGVTGVRELGSGNTNLEVGVAGVDGPEDIPASTVPSPFLLRLLTLDTLGIGLVCGASGGDCSRWLRSRIRLLNGSARLVVHSV